MERVGVEGVVKEALKQENQINDSIVIRIDVKRGVYLVTSKKREDLRVYKLPEGDRTPIYGLNGYLVEELGEYEYLGKIEGSGEYRDGGITTDEEKLAERIIEYIVSSGIVKRKKNCKKIKDVVD